MQIQILASFFFFNKKRFQLKKNQVVNLNLAFEVRNKKMRENGFPTTHK